MEVRASLAWPKDLVQQERRSSLGVGLGFEVLFGTDMFLLGLGLALTFGVLNAIWYEVLERAEKPER